MQISDKIVSDFSDCADIAKKRIIACDKSFDDNCKTILETEQKCFAPLISPKEYDDFKKCQAKNTSEYKIQNDANAAIGPCGNQLDKLHKAMSAFWNRLESAQETCAGLEPNEEYECFGQKVCKFEAHSFEDCIQKGDIKKCETQWNDVSNCFQKNMLAGLAIGGLSMRDILKNQK